MKNEAFQAKTAAEVAVARLKSGGGADRALDGEIMFSLFAKPVGQNGYLWPEDNPSWSFAIRFPGKNKEWFEKNRGTNRETILVWRDGDPILMNSLRVPPLTASLDAGKALIDRILPGWMWTVYSATSRMKARAVLVHPQYRTQVGEEGPDIYRATLIAIFRAASPLPHSPVKRRG